MGASLKKPQVRGNIVIQDPRNGNIQATVPMITFSELKFVGATLEEALSGVRMAHPTAMSAEDHRAYEGLVGYGASAVVRKATWQGKTVAVKLYHPGFEGFSKEVVAHSCLSHPAMISLYGTCFENNRLALVMEYDYLVLMFNRC